MDRISIRDDVDAPRPRRTARTDKRRAWRLTMPVIAALVLFGALGPFGEAERGPRDAASAAPGMSDPASRPFVPSAAVTVRPAVSVAASAPRYRLDDPDALDPVRIEPARINPGNGRREDGLSQGSFIVGEAPYLRITLGDEGASSLPASLFVTIARRAADG